MDLPREDPDGQGTSKNIRRTIATLLLWPMSLMAVDSDGDLIPDAWEDSHSMDKNNPEDASVDFDRDGLSALEEFQLKAEGLGEGPLGKWTTELVSLDFMNRRGSSSNRKEIIDFNDRGDILVNLTSWTAVWGSAPTYYYRVWFFNGSDSTWRKLSTVGGQEPGFLIAHDLNNEGIIVGQARAGTANGGLAFGFMKDLRAAPIDESVSPWLDSGNGTVGDLTGINDFGEVIGVDAAGASFFQSPSAGTVSCPPGWVNPVFTAINNWGEVAGVEYSDYWGIGAPRHFLMTPGWHWLTDFPAFDIHLLDPEGSELADSFGAGFRPTWINDWGEFTGNYWIETENQWWSGSWYFDGYEHDATMTGTDPVVRYRDLLPEGYTHQTVRGLNNWPQILVSASTNDQEESPEDFEVFLVNGPQRVALSALSSVPAISDHTYENSMPVAINNRGTIIGWANSGNSLYLLTLNQDRDGDGMSNDWETFHGLDPDDPSDALDDPDGDGANNLAEFRLGSAPTSTGYRLALDSDGDGLPDAWERKMFGNLSAGPDDDSDGDGLDNWEEWVIGSDPQLWDSDGDGWDDFEEFFIRGTDPSNEDTDGDGIPDLAENLAGSDPKDPVSRPRFPPYLRVEVKTVTNSELIPDEFVTPEFYYWAVHVPLDSTYNQGFSSALFDLSLADRQNDGMDQSPLKNTRLVSDYPGTEDYRFSVLLITTIHGNGDPQVVNVEMKEFMIPAGQKVSNEIATEAEQEGLVYLVPVPVDMDIIKPGTEKEDNSEEVAEDKEDWNTEKKDGGWVASLNWDDDDQDGGDGGHGNIIYESDFDDNDGTESEDDLIQLKVHRIAVDDLKGRLKFDGEYFRVWKKQNRTEEVKSEDTEFDIKKNEDLILYVEELKITEAEAPKQIELEIKVENYTNFTKGEEVSLHVSTPIILLRGRHDWTGNRASENLAKQIRHKKYLSRYRIDDRNNTVVLKGKNEDDEQQFYQVDVFDLYGGSWGSKDAPPIVRARDPEGDKYMKMALGVGGAHVFFDGHSNFGVGPNFSLEAQPGITGYCNLTGNGRTYINIESMATADHGSLTPEKIDDSEIFGDVENYLVPRSGIKKFGNYFPVGQIQTRKNHPDGGLDYHFTYTLNDLNYGTIVKTRGDVPALRYSSCFMSSCDTGRHFTESLNHGVYVYTVGLSYSVVGEDGTIAGDLLTADLQGVNRSWKMTHYVRLLVEGTDHATRVTFLNQNQWKYENKPLPHAKNYLFTTFE